MKTKKDIVTNWLPRYTGTPLENFGDFILLTNFIGYVNLFSEKYGVEIIGEDKAMQTTTSNNITMVNFGMGSAMAATIMDLLSAIKPKAVLFLGKCGGLKKKTKLGHFIIPMAAIRGEGTSNEYLPKEVPALPSFRIQRTVALAMLDIKTDYWTGVIFTTNRRVWEHDEKFKKRIKETRAIGIDIETATLFTAGFINEIPRGALLLVSDNPMIPSGVHAIESDKSVTSKFEELHINIGIRALEELRDSDSSVKHMRFKHKS
ncbi:MAG: AMP nucleosidase [Flavobacteriales bacterium]|nr:AMP nucleosidase [Flavobacteriales bacterium]